MAASVFAAFLARRATEAAIFTAGSVALQKLLNKDEDEIPLATGKLGAAQSAVGALTGIDTNPAHYIGSPKNIITSLFSDELEREEAGRFSRQRAIERNANLLARSTPDFTYKPLKTRRVPRVPKP